MLPPFYADADLIFHAAVIFIALLPRHIAMRNCCATRQLRRCALLLRRFHFVC
jgi:hypothetical protein